ncbi:mechanosensitive ion channel family protein [Sphingomonas sp.]|uniref:mechanosensitive ion channel family protein n=1 Tax=Sphingomonas sp. TaxID=28214 RepID=UPI0035AEF58C
MTLPEWLQANGLDLPSQAEGIEAAIATGLVLAMLGAGTVAGRVAGPRFAGFWTRHAANHGELVAGRLCTITRYLTSAVLLAILSAAWHWSPWAQAPIGLALGITAALAAVQMLRGLGLPRWMAWAAAAMLFVGLFSQAVGGLAPIIRVLEAIGFNIGTRRFSLMLLVTMLVTVVALYAVVRLANRVVEHWIAHARGLDPTQRLLGQKLASIAIVVAAFFFGTDLLEIDLTTFAIFSGGLGLAVGFGLQKTIGNLIAGIILLLDRSIKPGDVIALGQEIGWVNKIGVRAVSIVTRDGKEHLIPNENLMTQEVENWSYSDRNVRVRIPVRVSYDADLRLAQQLMLRAAAESPRVLKSPSRPSG